SARISPPSQSLPQAASTTPTHISDEVSSSLNDSVFSSQPHPQSLATSTSEVPSQARITPVANVDAWERHSDYSPGQIIHMSHESKTSRRSRSRGKTILLIGLVILMLMAIGSGLFYITRANQTTTANVHTTATTVANPYGGRLVLNDPLRDNSMG